jgi:hypothetical protein
MSATQLLDRLDGVKSNGAGRWLARCPAHDDRRPSLSIREMDSGMVLLHCWAGCAFDAIVDAAGLQPSDLYPPKPLLPGTHSRSGYSTPFPARDALIALSDDITFVCVCARDMANGEALPDIEIARLFTIAGRCNRAVGAFK